MFTSTPLNKAIKIALERIYDWKEVNTDIPKAIMKEMVPLSTKDVYFLFEDEIYQQTDGVAVGSPLSPILNLIFMVELEITIAPTLGNLLRKWKWYIDDTFCIVKADSVNETLFKLSSFHMNMQFTYEAEKNNMLPFLNVLVIWKNNNIANNCLQEANQQRYLFKLEFAFT